MSTRGSACRTHRRCQSGSVEEDTRSILSLDRRNIDQTDRLEYVKKSANYDDYQMVMDALKSGKHNNIALDLPEGWNRVMRLVWAGKV